MAAERPTPTPPPIPRKGNRVRQQTQELDATKLEEVGGVVELARTLLRERINNAKDSNGNPHKPHPDQLKLGVHIEISKIREKEPMMTYAQADKVEEAMDFMLRNAGIGA